VGGSRRQWGWHQLDPRWAERLVREARVEPHDLVLDVGAGRGALTAPLLATGARVIAIEAHPGRAAHLRRRFGGDLTVVEADARDLRLPRRPFRVVANPPYAITADLLRRLVHRGSRLEAGHLLLQADAARRWAGPSAPAVDRWGRHLEATVGRPVPRSAFHPRPQVDNRVLVLRRRGRPA
jgi:23S rRNA (adenine-N6)-dimethyltransferase